MPAKGKHNPVKGKKPKQSIRHTLVRKKIKKVK